MDRLHIEKKASTTLSNGKLMKMKCRWIHSRRNHKSIQFIMPPKKQQKVQHPLNSALPRGDGLTEVLAEDDEEYNFEDPADETPGDQLDAQISSSRSSKEIREVPFSTMLNKAQEKVNDKVPGGVTLAARRAAERVYLEFPHRITDIVTGPGDMLDLMIDDLAAVMLLYHEDRGKIADRKPLAELDAVIPTRRPTSVDQMVTRERELIKRQAIDEAEEVIAKQDNGLAIYASCVRGAESTYVQYGLPGESDTVHGTRKFFMLLVTDLARLMVEVASGKEIGDLSPSEEVMNLHVADPGGRIPIVPQAELTGLLAFAGRKKSTAPTSSTPSTPRGKTSGSSMPASSPMGKSGSAQVKTRNCIIRKFFRDRARQCQDQHTRDGSKSVELRNLPMDD